MPKAKLRKERLESLMRRKGFTFKSLGDEIGVNEKTLRNFRDGGNISINTLIDLAATFHVTVDYLIGSDILDIIEDNELNRTNIMQALTSARRIIDSQKTKLEAIAEIMKSSDDPTLKNKRLKALASLDSLIKRLQSVPKRN